MTELNRNRIKKVTFLTVVFFIILFSISFIYGATTQVEVAYETGTGYFNRLIVNPNSGDPLLLLENGESRKFIDVTYPYNLLSEIESELNAESIYLRPNGTIVDGSLWVSGNISIDDLKIWKENDNIVVSNFTINGILRGRSPLIIEENIQYINTTDDVIHEVYIGKFGEPYSHVPEAFDNSLIYDTHSVANQYNMEIVFFDGFYNRSIFVLNEGVVGRATTVRRSFQVIGNTTVKPDNESVTLCEGYSYIDCATDETGADLGVADDIEAIGSIYTDENLYIGSCVPISSFDNRSGLICGEKGGEFHNSLSINTDTRGLDGIVGLHSYLYSSVPVSSKTSVNTLLEIDGSNINSNSHASFIDMRIIGNSIEGATDALSISPEITHIIHMGSADNLSSAWYENTTDFVSVIDNITQEHDDVELFHTFNSTLYLCNDGNFTTVSFSLDTGSEKDLDFAYWYCSIDNGWQILNGVVDTTNGFKISGSINFMNPNDRGLCNYGLDGTPFPGDSTNYHCIALQRQFEKIPDILPIVNTCDISGGFETFILQKDLMKLNPVDTAPETCDFTQKGGIYFDISEDSLCQCTSEGWKVIHDNTACT